tara:strand:- start:1458 stop:1910 length:453 start_codon:yes stop_codon:yes gene_type:complete
MKIRKFLEKDSVDMHKLVCKVFNKFVAKDFTKAGVKKFLENQSPEENVKRAKTRDIFVAIVDGKIVGMIEDNKKGRITRLFIYKKYHGKGIATQLVNRIENSYKKKLGKMKVWSSKYAINFYYKLGFKKSRGFVRTKDGIAYQPMVKKFY